MSESGDEQYERITGARRVEGGENRSLRERVESKAHELREKYAPSMGKVAEKAKELEKRFHHEPPSPEQRRAAQRERRSSIRLAEEDYKLDKRATRLAKRREKLDAGTGRASGGGQGDMIDVLSGPYGGADMLGGAGPFGGKDTLLGGPFDFSHEPRKEKPRSRKTSRSKTGGRDIHIHINGEKKKRK